ncbi:MAG TPA: hypothetical protein VD704_05640 [Gaiellaceae bacterium]|nr:hypothetical protein [Gaiellaceae bacterium]
MLAGRSSAEREAEAQTAEAERFARARAFVWASLLTFFALLGGVLVVNTVVDPFQLVGTGLLPPAVENDRSTKLTLIDELEEPPEILILGNSRARQAEPGYLEQLTGRSGFNAGFTGGTAADAWVTSNHLQRRLPLENRGVIWFVDVHIATHGVNPSLAADPRAEPYLAGEHGFGLDDVGTYLGTEATGASLRVLLGCVTRLCRPAYGPIFLADGSIDPSTLQRLPEYERAAELRSSVQELVRRVRTRPPRGRRIVPRRFTYFERTLAFMNEHGTTPVLVLNPVHPAVLVELRKHGHPERRSALRYLRSLRERYDFVFVDAEDIRAWGGSTGDFANANHVNRRNMRRLLEYIVARSRGALG